VAPVTVDAATGDLRVQRKLVFPIGLSNPPPVDGVTPSGASAWAAIAAGGVTFVRNYTTWQASSLDEQLISVGHELDVADDHGLRLWLGLAGVAVSLSTQSTLDRIVSAFKGHPGLGVWKGADEPAHGRVPAAGCVAVYDHLRARDPLHPVAIIEAPRGPSPQAGGHDVPLTTAAIAPYAAACDIHGVDIYPLPSGAHAGGPPVETDLSVVGDMTELVARATGRRAIWTTLQIAWSGVLPPRPAVFPTLAQQRFMAYDAVVAGARGLFWFGGHLEQVMDAADRPLGWNWSYWDRVLQPLLRELTDAQHMQALTAPLASTAVRASASDIGVSAREAGGALYVIAVRRSQTASSEIRFAGLPTGVTAGTVLAHGTDNPARAVHASGGGFTDPSPFGPHNARVYRFALS
jgi:hypothetical protein